MSEWFRSEELAWRGKDLFPHKLSIEMIQSSNSIFRESCDVAKNAVALPRYSSCLPLVSGSAKASKAASKKAELWSKKAGPRPYRAASIPIAKGASADKTRPTL